MNGAYAMSSPHFDEQGTIEHQTLALPKIVLLDDDLMFCHSMAFAARKLHIPLQTFARLDDIPRMMDSGFDLAILDFDLGAITGAELAAFVNARVGGIPIVMVSFTKREPLANAPWPDIVQGFMLKDAGPESILNFALEAFTKGRFKIQKGGAKTRKRRTYT